jgi:hypothetical protein
VIELRLTDKNGLKWAQSQVVKYHYLHKKVIELAMPVAYLLHIPDKDTPVGCLIFSRTQCSKCYQGGLRFGNDYDKSIGKVKYTQWEIINLARVWLDPCLQKDGDHFVYNAASQVVSQSLQTIPLDYLIKYPPINIKEDYKLRVCLSYCDTTKHQGTLYRATGFTLAYEKKGIQTYMRPLRGLQGHERKMIERASLGSIRAHKIRTARANKDIEQLSIFDGAL